MLCLIFCGPNKQTTSEFTTQCEFFNAVGHLGRHLDFLEMPKGDKMSSSRFLTHLCIASHKWDTDKQCRPDQTPQTAASDLGLHCLH